MAQKLQAGFSYDEFIRILGVTAYQVDTPWVDMNYDYPKGFKLEYRSPEVALLNRWSLLVSAVLLVILNHGSRIFTQQWSQQQEQQRLMVLTIIIRFQQIVNLLFMPDGFWLLFR
jgi:hypothetical protein